MTQKTIYVCDHCQQDIGLKKHFSLVFANSSVSGIALPPTKERGWRMGTHVNGFLHFCSVKCLSAYFKKLLGK